MPAFMKYFTPNAKERDSFMASGLSERRIRSEQYNKARDYFEGKQPRQLDIKENEPDDNVIINITKMAIERTIGFLFPSMPTLELAPHETAVTPEEKWLKDAWAFNNDVVFLQSTAENGALGGHPYVRVLPPRITDKYPRLINLDPNSVITYWKADDLGTVLWHELYWTAGSAQYILDIINNGALFPDDMEKQTWTLRQWSKKTGTRWTEDGTQEWEYRFGPIVQWQHIPNPGKFYGRNEASNLSLNDSLNLIISENMRINRYHSAPKTVGIGIDPSDIQKTSIDGLWTTKNPEADIHNLEMKSEQRFAQELAALLYDSFLAEHRVVLLRGEVKDFQRVTNAGVRTVFMDMLAKNSILRYQYGLGIQSISQRMAMLSKMGDDIIPDVVHGDPLPVDDVERIAAVEKERTLNLVSRETASTQRGYNWDDEKMKMDNEAKDPALVPPPPQMGGGFGNKPTD